jgi:Rrf2 family protein
MRFNKDIEYALMSLTAMSGSGELTTARDLAEEYQIPYGLLSKILQRLANAGVLESVKGAHGGYRLHRRNEEITLGEIIEAVQGPKHVAPCLDDEDCFQAEVCIIKGSIRGVQSMWDRMINSMTLEDFSRSETGIPS